VVVTLQPGTQVTIGALKLTFERRATGEHRAAPPRTQFAIRAATVMRQAVKPGTLAGAGPEAGAPPPPPSAEAPLAGTPPDAAALAAIAEALATPLGEAGLPPPPPPLEPEPLPPLASAVVDQALEGASLDLDLLYASYRGSWEHLRAKMDETVAAMDAASRTAAGRRLADKYPAALQEPQFRELAGTPAPAPAAAPSPGAAPAAARRPPAAAPAHASSDAEELLTAFAESYLPASVQVRTPEQRQAFLSRVAEALETFGRSFVEMRKGYEEFGKQMGVRTVHGDGPVERSRDPRQLLASLLDPGQHGRVEELQAAFADYMVHQVAILNGVTEGAKAMLRGLSPESIEAKTQGMWPMKGQALWKAFEERFHAIFDEDDAVSDALFGREFGRAYSAIVGKRGTGDAAGGGDDEEDDRPRPAKARRR
jgi:type VI secretion system protein